MRTHGYGRLVPEVDFQNRLRPVVLQNGLRLGTVFCWEVFSIVLWAAYRYGGCNLITHPVKFAPAGYPKKGKRKGETIIESFGLCDKGKWDIWKNRLLAANLYECFCPILVSCNIWNLGKKFVAVCGHVDEVFGSTRLYERPSTDEGSMEAESVLDVASCEAIDHQTSFGQFIAAGGGSKKYQQSMRLTMIRKIHRIEAQFIGGDTQMQFSLMTNKFNKPSVRKRASRQRRPHDSHSS
jgi:hypothetical protein